MLRYTVSSTRSRGSSAARSECRPVGPPGARPFTARRDKRRAETSWSLVGSFAMHACMAVVLVLAARRAPPPAQPATEAITVIFTPAPVTGLPEAAPPAPDFAAEPLTTQPLPAPEPPKAEQPPSVQVTIPEPEPPPSVALPAPPPPPMPPPPRSAQLTTPEPEPPPALNPPAPPEIMIPEPPPPVDLSAPPPSMPSPLVSPKREPHPPPPRLPSNPRPSNAAPAAPAPAQTQSAAAGAPPIKPVSPPPPTAINPGWQSALGAWLQANKTYPDEARRRGEEGRAAVRFTVNRDGRIIDFQLLSRTGSTVLDAAVERLLRGARVPPFPAGMDQEQVTVTLQIRYTLER